MRKHLTAAEAVPTIGRQGVTLMGKPLRELVEELKALEVKATKAPWEQGRIDDEMCMSAEVIMNPLEKSVACFSEHPGFGELTTDKGALRRRDANPPIQADLDYIVKLRNSAPAIIETLSALIDAVEAVAQFKHTFPVPEREIVEAAQRVIRGEDENE